MTSVWFDFINVIGILLLLDFGVCIVNRLLVFDEDY